MLQRRWPHWWDDPISISHHARRRMQARGVSETTLRLMLEDSDSLRIQPAKDTWIATTILRGVTWEIVIKPDLQSRRILVVTLYPRPG